MSDKKLDIMQIGTVITLYDLWGESAAIKYITQVISCTVEESQGIIEEIKNSNRYAEHLKRKEIQRRMEEQHRIAQQREAANNMYGFNAKTSNKYSLKPLYVETKHKDKEVRREKKKNTMVFIDAESVSADKCPGIVGQSKSAGEIYEIRYYARQKDNSTVAWKDMAKQYGIKPILMAGEPQKNKIDNKIIKDIKHILETNKSIDVFCIATRDGDYKEIVEYIQQRKKRAIVLATKNTSESLKDSASEVRGI